MTRSSGDEEVGGGRSRLAVAAAIGGGLLLVAGAALWLERAPIVEHFVDRALARAHVPGRYRIVAIGPFAERLEDVAIGDPAAPDLTVRRLELTLGYTLDGPYVAAVSADGVRLRAAVAGGHLSFGALDRLLPASSGGPLRLPDLRVQLSDAEAAVATPAGPVRLALDGQGRLSDGFAGHLAAASPGLALGGCTTGAVKAAVAVRIAARRPHLAGPVDLARLACANGLATGAGRATLDVTLAAALDRGTGSVALAGFPGRVPGARFGPLGGSLSFTGGAARVEGQAQLTAADVEARGVTARQALVRGRYRYAPGGAGLVYAGDLALAHAALEPRQRQALARQAAGLSATPLGPILTKGAGAVTALLADADATATVALTVGGRNGPAARLRRLLLVGRSGGQVRIDEGEGFGWNLAERNWRADGRLHSGGGGLPTIDVVLHQPRVGAPVEGVATLVPYAAGGARLALTPVRFAATGGRTRFSTVATVDGTAGGVRAEGLALPLTGWFGGGAFRVGEACVPIRVRRLMIAGATIEDGAIRACGIGDMPILRLTPDGYFGIGLEVRDARVSGHSGGSPLSLAAAHVTAAPWGFKAEGVSARLGAGEGQTRLDVGALDGSFLGGFAGSFADAGGKIGRVPLLLSGAGGSWSVDGGALSLDGGLTVSDAGLPARFRPLAGRDVSLALTGGVIGARGVLAEPASGATVADVTLRHDLGTGQGDALLSVPGLAFAPGELQPEALTPLTLGIVANVAGTVAGGGRIAWGPAGVRSTGEFATDRLDLAAAFGPVTGIAGTIHFTDLLGLETPPHQEATVAEVNPGVAVTGGVVHYQLLPGQRIRVEDARWPFAGGALTLAPTTLVFGEGTERRLTFDVRALDAAAFVNQLALPNLNATGTFDGTLPMVFDDRGGRISGGAIVARPPGGTLAYVGELSRERVGTMGRLAFDALKAIRYRSLAIDLDGRLDGEMISRVRFDGIRQATPDAGLVARMIHNLPFRFNIAIRAPFRALLGTARSYGDPSLLLADGVQPAASEPVR